jgi:hypothetical protein
MLKIILALRNKQHQVDVVQPNGATRPVLGTTQPGEENRRVNVVRQWHGECAAPRNTAPEGITVPYSQRTQTILSHQLNPELQNKLNGGLPPLAQSRGDNQNPSNVPLQSGADDTA